MEFQYKIIDGAVVITGAISISKDNAEVDESKDEKKEEEKE